MIDDLFWEKVAGKWSVIMEQKEDKVVPPLSSVLEDDWPLDGAGCGAEGFVG